MADPVEDVEGLFTLALLAGAAYLVYKFAPNIESLFKGVSTAASTAVNAATTAQQSAASSIADAALNITGQTVTPSDLIDYWVTFDDGSQAYVPGSTVDSNGDFTWTGYPAGSQEAQSCTLFQAADGSYNAVCV